MPKEALAAARPATVAAVEAIPVDLPLSAPIDLGGRLKLAAAEAVVVRIESADGVVGWGEAAAAPNFSGEFAEGMAAAIRRFLGPAIVGLDARRLPEARAALDGALRANPAAKAAVDLALLDLAGRALGVPACDLLGGAKRTRVAVLRMLGNATIDADVEEAARARHNGLAAFKLKVGTRPLDSDIAAARAVRAAIGPDARLSVDANATWSEDKALAFARAAADVGIAYIEQPLPVGRLAATARLMAGAGVPVCADEGIGSPADIDAHAAAGAAAGASLKPIKLGGYGHARRAAERCAAIGWRVNLAAKVAESSLATAGLLHLAAAAPTLDWDLTPTHHYLAGEYVRLPFVPRGGALDLPDGPGLGVDIDPARLAEFRRR